MSATAVGNQPSTLATTSPKMPGEKLNRVDGLGKFGEGTQHKLP